MNDGQPGKMIASNQSHRLASSLKLSRRLSLFNIGRLTSVTSCMFICFIAYNRTNDFVPHHLLFTSLALAAVVLPILLSGMLFGARLGLFGAAEFFCGLAYLPMGTIGGAAYRERAHQMLALIYSGVGRFEEAIRCMQRHDRNLDPFYMHNSTPWNERRRLPELLSRLGLDDQACALMLQNLSGDRRDLADVDCEQFSDMLQCDLIAAANILHGLGRNSEAVSYLEEATALGERPQPSQSAKILGLYSSGLASFHRNDFLEAAQQFENCSAEIESVRLRGKGGDLSQTSRSAPVSAKVHSELLALSQIFLGRCCMQLDQTQKLPAILNAIKSENYAEPPTGEDSIASAVLESDYWRSQGQEQKALEILENKLKRLRQSDCDADKMIPLILQKCDIKTIRPDLEPIDEYSLPQVLATSNQPTKFSLPTASRATVPQQRLPGLAHSRDIANRSVLTLFALVGGAVAAAVTGHSETIVVMWALFSAIALVQTENAMRTHILNSKRRRFIEKALESAVRVDVVLEMSDKRKALIRSGRCLIVEGPEDCRQNELHLSFSDNLLYASKACQAGSDNRIKARLYREASSGQALAIETVGRVIRVAREKKDAV